MTGDVAVKIELDLDPETHAALEARDLYTQEWLEALARMAVYAIAEGECSARCLNGSSKS